MGVCDILGGHRPPEGAVPWANSTSLPEPSQNAVQPAPGKSSSLLNTSELVDPEDNLSLYLPPKKEGMRELPCPGGLSNPSVCCDDHTLFAQSSGLGHVHLPESPLL